MGRLHGVKVTGEVQVDFLRRLHGGAPTAGAAALVTEHRAERRLPNRQRHALAEAREPLGQPHGNRGFAFPRWRRRNGGNHHQPTRNPAGGESVERHLRLDRPVRFHVAGFEPKFRRHFRNGTKRCVCFHAVCPWQGRTARIIGGQDALAPRDSTDWKGISRERNSNANQTHRRCAFAPSRPRLGRWSAPSIRKAGRCSTKAPDLRRRGDTQHRPWG